MEFFSNIVDFYLHLSESHNFSEHFDTKFANIGY